MLPRSRNTGCQTRILCLARWRRGGPRPAFFTAADLAKQIEVRGRAGNSLHVANWSCFVIGKGWWAPCIVSAIISADGKTSGLVDRRRP